MPPKYLKLSIQKGETFGRTFLFGQGRIFTVTGLADAGGGNVTVAAPGHTYTNGARVKVIAVNPAKGISYAGAYTAANVVAGVSFTIVATWQGSVTGTAQAARDLTGKSIRAKGWSQFGDDAPLITLTGVIPDPTGGVATLAATSEETDLAVTASAVWGCEFFDAAAPPVVEPLFVGNLEITVEGA